MKTKLNLRKAVGVALCALALSPAALLAGNVPKTAEERGIIKSVNLNAHQIVVTNQKAKADETYQWTAQTKFTEHHKSVAVGGLKAGMQARLTYQQDNGTRMLKEVKLAPAPTQKHTASATHSAAKS